MLRTAKAGGFSAQVRAPRYGSVGDKKGKSSMPRKHTSVMLGVGFLVVLGVVVPDVSTVGTLLRRKLASLATICIHNIYANETQALYMPPVPNTSVSEPAYVPSYISMCYDWMRRDALSTEGAIYDIVRVRENRDICLDWSAPHYAMMEIAASAVLNTIVPRVQYRHNCTGHRTWDESILGFDWSPFQVIFQEAAMMVDQNLVIPNLMEEQCKICLESYDPALEETRIKSRSLHHCFAFPETATTYRTSMELTVDVQTPTPVNDLPETPQIFGNIAPISTIARVFHNRLHHSAIEFANVTDYPPGEWTSGVVIIIEPGSYGINNEIYKDYIPPGTTSISIIAPPTCVVAHLPTGQECMGYAKDLLLYLETQFPGLDGNGFKGGPGVTLQISASTAGTFSRGILADTLICPPNTLSCLTIAFGKFTPTKGILFDVPPGTGPLKFIEVMGTWYTTQVIQLPLSPPSMPDIVEGTPQAPQPLPIPPLNNTNYPTAPSFLEAQVPITGDGYPPSTNPLPVPATPAEVNAKTTLQIFQDIHVDLPPAVQYVYSTTDPSRITPIYVLPNVDAEPTEIVPTPQQIADALAEGVPLDMNTFELPPLEVQGQPASLVSTELAASESLNFQTIPLTAGNYQELAVKRRDSKLRLIDGVDKTYLFEIYCPEQDELGNAFIVDDGVVIYDNGDTVTVSDGTDVVVFEAPVEVTTTPVVTGPLTDPLTNITTIETYTTLDDPILNTTVNVTTGSGVYVDPDAGLTVDHPVGTLVSSPDTGHGALLTTGSAGTAGEPNPTHTMICGEIVSVGRDSIQRTDRGTVVRGRRRRGGRRRHGKNGKKNAKNGLEVIAKNDYTGFRDTDPAVEAEEGYQQVVASSCEAAVERNMETYDKCTYGEFSNPIYIESQDTVSVTFAVHQTFKGWDSISWVAVDMPGQDECEKTNGVGYGETTNSPTYTAICTDGKATVDIYVHDGQFGQTDNSDITSQIPGRCEPSKDKGKKCFYQFILDCTGTCQPTTRRLTEEQPEEEPKLMFAQNLLRECPNLGKKRVFNKMKFGGKFNKEEAVE